MMSLKLNRLLANTGILLSKLQPINVTSVAAYKDFKLPPKIEVEGFPEANRLKVVPKTPTYPVYLKAPKLARRIAHMRGPELVHNQLIHKQYGILALSGGSLKFGHYEMIRQTVNRVINPENSFAVWRIDPPSKPKTKHGQGKKLGGGKGGIDHYIMPIKRGRVIIEVGGHVRFETVLRKLQETAEKLPFPAKAVTQQMMEEMEEEERQMREQNINELNWEWCVKNNILNSVHYLSRYDLEWAHISPDCR